jgi:hypothetical protein
MRGCGLDLAFDGGRRAAGQGRARAPELVADDANDEVVFGGLGTVAEILLKSVWIAFRRDRLLFTKVRSRPEWATKINTAMIASKARKTAMGIRFFAFSSA